MRTIINYIRSRFCKHKWERIARVDIYEESHLPVAHKTIYRCKKCGFTQRIKY